MELASGPLTAAEAGGGPSPGAAGWPSPSGGLGKGI
jgi:hypothetical protein